MEQIAAGSVTATSNVIFIHVGFRSGKGIQANGGIIANTGQTYQGKVAYTYPAIANWLQSNAAGAVNVEPADCLGKNSASNRYAPLAAPSDDASCPSNAEAPITADTPVPKPSEKIADPARSDWSRNLSIVIMSQPA